MSIKYINRSDSFGPFLKSIQASEAVPGESGGTPTSQSTVKLLSAIQATGEASTTDLMRSTGLGVVEFATLLRDLRDLKVLEIIGEPGQEAVHLTDFGKQLLSTLLPK